MEKNLSHFNKREYANWVAFSDIEIGTWFLHRNGTIYEKISNEDGFDGNITLGFPPYCPVWVRHNDPLFSMT